MVLGGTHPRCWFELTPNQQREWLDRERDQDRLREDLEVQLRQATDDHARALAAADRKLRDLRSDLEAAEEENSLLAAALTTARAALLDIKKQIS